MGIQPASPTRRSLRRAGALSLALAMGPGCAHAPSSPPREGESLFVDAGPYTTPLWGITWDPEAYWFNLGQCGEKCPAPPMLLVGNPLYTRTVITGASIRIFDPELGRATADATAPSGPDGTWNVPGVPSRAGRPFFVTASGGSLASPQGPPVPLPPVPPTHYQPTFTFRPIQTSYSFCAFQQANLLGDSGILDAVARYLTAQGTGTTVADLLDAKKWRSVSVWGLFQPGLPNFVRPAAGTSVRASAGRVLNIGWAPPGADLPAGRKALQSSRGFIVVEGPTSPLGVAVVLQPASAPPAPMTITAYDPTSEPGRGRPWSSAPIDVPLVPGEIVFAPLHLTPAPGSPVMPEPYLPFLCRSP